MEKMEGDRIGKIGVGECACSRSVDRPRKRWNDSVNHCLEKRSLNVGQARRIVYDTNELCEFVKGNARGVSRWMNP